MWQKNGGGRAREGKVSAEARNPTDKACGWVLWAKEGEDVMKSLRIKGPKKKRFGKNPLGCQFGVLGASRRRSVAVVLKSLSTQVQRQLRGGESAAADRCAKLDIFDHQGPKNCV